MRPATFRALLPLTTGLVCLAGCSSMPPDSTRPPAVSQPATAEVSVSPGATAPSPVASSQPSTGASAAAAFKVWVHQYNKEDWDKHYMTLVSAQQKIISAKKYAACRNKGTNLATKWIKAVKTKPNVKTRIPGTKVTLPATVVTARLRVSGVTFPIDAHMFYEKGAWRWSMTKPNVANCT